MIALATQPEHRAAEWWLNQCRVPAVRSLREFAEAEIVIPDGPFKGERFKISRQPYTGLLFDAIDSGQWSRVVVLGPTQSGKTLCGYIIIVLWHLFECVDTVIAGLPDMNMANDKWGVDFLPVIERTRFNKQRPAHGPGSRGGAVKNAVAFLGAGVLKFMTGGTGDAGRSHFTARVVAVTEADKLDEAGGTSREGDKISQMEVRADSYGIMARTYLECTVSFRDGRIWREFVNGTESRIACPCSHCREYVTPEREHLTGWQDAETVTEARRKASWCCPGCGVVLTEKQRRRMNERGILLHKGQTVSRKGVVRSKPPDTDTLGFRWNAWNNLFWTAADVGAREWRAARDPNEENAKKLMHQFVWAIPYDPPRLEDEGLSFVEIRRRVGETARGEIPAESQTLVAACDIGKRLLHWVAVAFDEEGSGRVVEYSEIEVPSDAMREERAILLALRDFRDVCSAGWQRNGEVITPACVLIDAGHWGSTVYAFIREAGQPFWPSKGFGTAGIRAMPAAGYRMAVDREAGVRLIEIDADAWKRRAYEGLRVPTDQAGALTLFKAEPTEHTRFAKHCSVEAPVREFARGRELTRFQDPKRRPNHFWDALYMACCAGHLAGVRLLEPDRPKAKEPRPSPERPGEFDQHVTKRRRRPSALRRGPIRRTYG